MTGVRGSDGPRPRASLWVLWPTLGASWIAFAQVLSFQGLVVWVVGGSLLGGLAVGVLARYGRTPLALVAMVALPIVVAGATEVVGGTTAGPITRSSLMTTAVAGSMGLLLNTPWSASMLLPSLFLLGGALGLGAAEDVLWLSGLWAVAAVTTLAMLGPFRNQHLRDRSRLAQFALLLVGLGFVAVVATVGLSFFLRDPWTIAGALRSESSNVTSGAVPLPDPSQVDDPPEVSAPPEPQVPPTGERVSTSAAVEESDSLAISLLRGIVLAVVTLLLLAVVLAVLWRAVVALRWLMVKRRLRSGSASDQVLGAWTWLRLQRERRERPLPAYVSSDVAMGWAREMGEADVLTVAQVATVVAYDPSQQATQTQARECWRAARQAVRNSTGGWRTRLRTGFRAPTHARHLGKTRTNRYSITH